MQSKRVDGGFLARNKVPVAKNATIGRNHVTVGENATFPRPTMCPSAKRGLSGPKKVIVGKNGP